MSCTSTPTIVIIFGEPNHGKSTCAYQLRDSHGFRVISGDWIYVRFIRDRLPHLFFPMLSEFVGPHYDAIVKAGMREKVFRTDVTSLWLEFVCNEIENQLSESHQIVAEGYTFKDIRDQLNSRLCRIADVKLVEMRGKKPYIDESEVSIDQIASPISSIGS